MLIFISFNLTYLESICPLRYKVEQKDVGVDDLIGGWRKTLIIIVTVVVAVCAPCTCFIVYMHDEMETYKVT